MVGDGLLSGLQGPFPGHAGGQTYISLGWLRRERERKESRIFRHYLLQLRTDVGVSWPNGGLTSRPQYGIATSQPVESKRRKVQSDLAAQARRNGARHPWTLNLMGRALPQNKVTIHTAIACLAE